MLGSLAWGCLEGIVNPACPAVNWKSIPPPAAREAVFGETPTERSPWALYREMIDSGPEQRPPLA